MDDEALHHAFTQSDDHSLQPIAAPIGIPLDPMLERVLAATKDLPIVRAVRPELEKIANQLLERLSADVVTILPYSPYWDEFDIPITSASATLQTIVPSYLHDKLRTLMAEQGQTTRFESTETLRELAPQFFEREKIETVNAICIYNEGLPVGIIFVNWHTEYELSFSERQRLDLLADEYRVLSTHNYTFSYYAEILYREMQFDLVRLHLFKQETLGKLQDLSQLIWGIRPITKGDVWESADWHKRGSRGPISNALNRYLSTGQHADFQDDTSTSDLFTTGTFTRLQELKSSGYVLLVVNEGQPDEEIVGIVFVSWRKQHKWTAAQTSALRIFAHQMATAIHIRRLVTTVEEQSISENWLQELLGSVLRHRRDSREDALQRVLETAATLTGAYCGDIRLKSGDRLFTEAAYGNQELQDILKFEYPFLPIDGKSLTCQTFRANNSAIYADVQKYENYIPALPNTQSEMIVIIRQVESGQPIGTINLEHTQLHGFKKSDRKRVIAIADVTAIILQNIERYFYLEEEMRTFQMLEEIAINGLIGANWLHEAGTRSRAIEVNVEIIRRLLHKHPQDADMIKTHLQEIVTIAETFVMHQQTLPKELDAVPPLLAIDQKLQESIRSSQDKYGFECTHDLNAADSVVPIHAIAFNMLIDHLIMNSVHATRSIGRDLTIHVATRRVDDFIEIVYIDNGPGIHGERLRYYLRERMPMNLRRGSSGMGMNIVLFILRRYKGEIRYIEQEHDGARHEIRIPVK